MSITASAPPCRSLPQRETAVPSRLSPSITGTERDPRSTASPSLQLSPRRRSSLAASTVAETPSAYCARAGEALAHAINPLASASRTSVRRKVADCLEFSQQGRAVLFGHRRQMVPDRGIMLCKIALARPAARSAGACLATGKLFVA